MESTVPTGKADLQGEWRRRESNPRTIPTGSRVRTHSSIYRRIAEEAIGRRLRPGEVVHHINGDRNDNRPENLQVLPSQAEHVRLHLKYDAITAREAGELILTGLTKAQMNARGISDRKYDEGRRVLGLARKSRVTLTRLGLDAKRSQRTLDYEAVAELRRQGLTYREIGRRLGCSHMGARYAFLQGR